MNAGSLFAAAGVLTNVPWDAFAGGSAGTSPVVTLAAGQTDVEPWADNQEVTLDRIVGQINLQGVSLQTFTEAPPVPSAPPTWVRLGMLVQEESDGSSSPFIDLWNDEHLEDYEWMWLREVIPTNWNYLQSSNPDVGAWGFTESIYIDSRLRRKIGQTDNLLLYCQYVSVLDSGSATVQTNVAGSHLLRSIFMSR